VDQHWFAENEYRLEHRHEDGAWVPMTEERSHHDPADHDVERSWVNGRIFKCTACEKIARVLSGDETDPVTGR
jgi:hypothetical protein